MLNRLLFPLLFRKITVLGLLGLLFDLNTCVATFDPTLNPNASSVVMEGILTDQPTAQASVLVRRWGRVMLIVSVAAHQQFGAGRLSFAT